MPVACSVASEIRVTNVQPPGALPRKKVKGSTALVGRVTVAVNPH
jgi:hypothetical protein